MPTAPKSAHAGVPDVAVPVLAVRAAMMVVCDCALLHAARRSFKQSTVLREARGGARDTTRTRGPSYGAPKNKLDCAMWTCRHPRTPTDAQTHAVGCGCVRAVEIRGILSTNQSYLSCGDAHGTQEHPCGGSCCCSASSSCEGCNDGCV